MALADELLTQAAFLATIDTGIPAQANLRRAVSSAYYALFHLLIAEAVDLLVPSQPRGLRTRASRAFSHADMRRVCAAVQKPVASSEFKERFETVYPRGVSNDLRIVAKHVTTLQEARHDADYDVSLFFSRADTLHQVESAKSAFTAWSSIRSTEEANVFLTALAFGARWSK